MEETKVLLLEGGKRPSRQTREELGAKGIHVTPAQDIAECLAALKNDPEPTVIVDLDLYPKAIEAVAEIHKAFPEVSLLVMASVQRLAVAEEALRQGAWRFILKQPDLSHVHEIPQAIAAALERKRLSAEAERYREEAARLKEAASQFQDVGRLREESRRYRKIADMLTLAVEQSGDGVWIGEPQGKIVFANSALRRRLGYDGDDLVGKPLDALIGSLENEGWKESSRPLPHKRWEGKASLTKRDGSQLAVTARLTQILDEKGAAEVLIGVCPESRQTPTVPDASSLARDEILAEIAEDLRSPITAMIGYLEIASAISPDRLEPNQLLSIQRIEALARRLFDIVTNHTDALDIEAGKFELQKSRLQLNEILELAVQARKNEAAIKNVEIALETEGELPPLSLDPVQLERAFGILIGNAIALSPIDGTVAVRSQLRGNEILISVKDNGAGLSEEEIRLLFDRRRRLRRRGAEINTVGLYVAHRIVTAHGGRIEVETSRLEGTTFTIFLPAQEG